MEQAVNMLDGLRSVALLAFLAVELLQHDFSYDWKHVQFDQFTIANIRFFTHPMPGRILQPGREEQSGRLVAGCDQRSLQLCTAGKLKFLEASRCVSQ